MEPLFDKLARLNLMTKSVRFVTWLFLATEAEIRIILIIGASACFVAGIKWIYWTTVCDCPSALPLAIVAFIPIVLIAPRSATRRPVLVIILAVLEVFVILSDCVLVLR